MPTKILHFQLLPIKAPILFFLFLWLESLTVSRVLLPISDAMFSLGFPSGVYKYHDASNIAQRLPVVDSEFIFF